MEKKAAACLPELQRMLSWISVGEIVNVAIHYPLSIPQSRERFVEELEALDTMLLVQWEWAVWMDMNWTTEDKEVLKNDVL